MKVSINYSLPAGELVDEGVIQVDVFKCPAWEDLLDGLSNRPVYVHFPLLLGRDVVINSEQKAPVDLDFIKRLRDKTHTPFVNTHFAPLRIQYPEIPADSLAPDHIERVVEDAVKQVRTLQAVFGDENVTVENIPLSDDRMLYLCALPDVIKRVVDETGCGFLFDIPHARLSARKLGFDEQTYMSALPVDRIREIHITGILRIDEAVIAQLETLGIDSGFFHGKLGQEADHVALSELDWASFEWVMGHIHRGEWATPEIVAFEYGGVGGFWEKLADKETIRQQVPRLYQIVNNSHNVQTS